jgi:hypothetical protein
MTDNLDRAVQEIVGFYRIYHSMRYVREQLVFRLTQKPSVELLERINQSFADILVDGQFTASEALREEHDEPAFIALPRLVFHFNRRSLGRLRQLVDFINRETVTAPLPAVAMNNHPLPAETPTAGQKQGR